MWAWKKCNTDESVSFSIPSGNFGNLTGGLLANQMGLPVEKFIASLNVNDTFLDYLDSGKLIKKETIKTISNAMDVSVPSNIERISCLYGNDVSEISKKISVGPILNIDTPKRGIAKKAAGTKPINVLNIAVKVSAAIISLNFIGAINKFVKFLLQISSRNIIL